VTEVPRLDMVAPAHAPFAGRRPELAAMRAHLSAARDGEPSAVVVMGEAGIGKSRLVRETLAMAEREGMQTCFGRFIERSAVPFLPFVGGLMPHLARGGLLPGVSSEADSLAWLGVSGGGERGGAANFVELARLAIQIADRRPLVLVFDDVHWASSAESEAIEHLALAIADAARATRVPICLLLVARPEVEASPAGPALARIRREPFSQILNVTGFDETTTTEFVNSVASGALARQLVSALQRATRGNPLFLGEALSALSQGDALVVRSGVITTSVDPEELSLPDEVTASIEARVDRLEPEVQRLLAIAALLGDEFEARMLERMAERPTETVEELLEQALEGRFLVEAGSRLRFVHPVVRHVCASRGTAIRRRRTHSWIARCLAEEGVASAERTLSIATHLIAAGSAADPLETARAAHLAGREATKLRAWGDAGRYFEAALAQNVYLATLAPSERAALVLDAAFAHYRNMDVPLSRERFEEAMGLSREAVDVDPWADALIGWARANVAHGGVRLGRMLDDHPYREFMTAAAAYPGPRARVQSMWAEVLWVAGEPSALALAEEALDTGKAIADDFIQMHAAFARGLVLLRGLRVSEALSAFELSLEHARELDDPWYQGWALQNVPICLMMLGRLGEAREACRVALSHGRVTHDWAVAAVALAYEVPIAVAMGEFGTAEDLAIETAAMVQRSSYTWAEPVSLAALTWGRILTGNLDGALTAADRHETLAGRAGAWPLRQLIAVAKGEVSGFNEVLERDARLALWEAPLDSVNAGTVALRGLLGRETNTEALARFPAAAFDAESAPVATVTPWLLASRVRGAGQIATDEVEAAARSLEQAVGEARAAGAQTELALALADLAEIRLPDDEEHATRYLREANVLASGLGMQPLWRRIQAVGASRLDAAGPGSILGGRYPNGLTELEVEVLTEYGGGRSVEETAAHLLLGELQVAANLESAKTRAGVTTPAAANRFLEDVGLLVSRTGEDVSEVSSGALRVMMFSDIVNSTTVNEALGDALWFELLSRHDRTIKECIEAVGGAYIKHTGDGVFASFVSATSAVDAALAIQSAFPMSLESRPEDAIEVRVGLHAGEPVRTRNDLFGLSVTLSKRVCDRGNAGDVLVSDAVKQLTDGGRFAFTDRGRFALKGLGQRVRIYRVSPLHLNQV